MPLYEYRCRGCAREFETLVRAGEEPECPACHGRDLERALSTFAVASGSSRTAQMPAPCGTCGDPRGPGACTM